MVRMVSFLSLGSFEVLILNKVHRAHCMFWMLMDSWIFQVYTCQKPWHYENRSCLCSLIAYVYENYISGLSVIVPFGFHGRSTKGFGNIFLPCSLFLQTVNYSLSTSINKCTHICYSKYDYILVILLFIARLYSAMYSIVWVNKIF